MSVKRTQRVNIRLSDDELQIIDEGAQERHMTRAAFMRIAALDAAVPVRVADEITPAATVDRGADNPLRPSAASSGRRNGRRRVSLGLLGRVRRLLPARAA